MIRKALQAAGWWLTSGAHQRIVHDRSLEPLSSRLEKIEADLARPNPQTMPSTADLLFQISNASGRYADPLSLCRFDASVYSQVGEDGIIAEIFQRVGTTNRFFVEVGIEDGRQNTTRFLLEQGWRGVWIDGDQSAVKKARANFASFIESGHLQIAASYVGPDNIEGLLRSLNVPSEIDLMSLDIDYGTSHLWRAINTKARALCIEYNSSVPASSAAEVPYDPHLLWDGTNWFGAGLKVLENIGREKGMDLVGCDLLGINAFFVSSPLTAGKFQPPFTADRHWEPARYKMIAHRGHPPSDQARSWIDGGGSEPRP